MDTVYIILILIGLYLFSFKKETFGMLLIAFVIWYFRGKQEEGFATKKPGVTLYYGSHFKGGSYYLPIGNYNRSSLENKNIPTYHINSFTVEPNTKVTVYRNGSFNGDSVSSTKDIVHISGLDSHVNSIQVEYIPTDVTSSFIGKNILLSDGTKFYYDYKGQWISIDMTSVKTSPSFPSFFSWSLIGTGTTLTLQSKTFGNNIASSSNNSLLLGVKSTPFNILEAQTPGNYYVTCNKMYLQPGFGLSSSPFEWKII